MGVIQDAFDAAFPDAVPKVPADARAIGGLLDSAVDISPSMFGLFPGVVSASAIVAMNTAAAGRLIVWPAGTYLVDDKMSFGTTPINWRPNGDVTLIFDADSHQGESWIRSDGSVSAPGFVFDGNNVVAKVWDARTAGAYTHALNFRGTTFKSGLQPGTTAPTTGAASGLITDGDFDVVDIRDAVFRDMDATSSGTGDDRGVSRGFQVAGMNNTSPRLAQCDGASFINITCSGHAWGDLESDADGLVWRNTNPDHALFGRGMTFRNCQKRFVKANIALNCFIDEPFVYCEAGKPTRTGFDFQTGSGGVRGGRFMFEDETAFPLAGVFGYMSDGGADDRDVYFDGAQIVCSGTIPNDGSGGTERCILSVGGNMPTGSVSLRGVQATGLDIPYLVNIRANAIASSPEANGKPVSLEVKDNRIGKVSQAAFVLSRSGTGFVYVAADVSGNSFRDGPSQTSNVMNDTNITLVPAAGNGIDVTTRNGVPTLGRQGYVMEPPTNGQALGSWPALSGMGAVFGRDRATSIGSTATNIRPTVGTSPLFGSYLVYGVDTTSATRWFFETVSFASQGTTPPVVTGASARNGPAARTYAVVGAELRLSMASGTYDVQCVALGFS